MIGIGVGNILVLLASLGVPFAARILGMPVPPAGDLSWPVRALMAAGAVVCLAIGVRSLRRPWTGGSRETTTPGAMRA